MKRYQGGLTVKGGYYVNVKDLRIVAISGAEGILGNKDEVFVKVPGLLLVPFVAAISGLFVVFLPTIGFWLLGKAVWGKVRRE